MLLLFFFIIEPNIGVVIKTNVKEAVKGYYFDQPTVPNIKLHLVKVGTLNSMLRAISLHKQVSKQDILDTL